MIHLFSAVLQDKVCCMIIEKLLLGAEDSSILSTFTQKISLKESDGYETVCVCAVRLH